MNAFLLAEEITWWHTWGEQIIWVAGILTAITLILKAPVINRPFKWLWRRLISEPLGGWSRRMVGTVVDEKIVQPNGGGSLRDQVDALKASQETLMGWTAEATANQVDIKQALVNIHTCLDTRFADSHARMEKLTEYAEEVLAEAIGAKERIRQLYRGLEVPIFESDAQGLCTYVNPAYCKLTGLSVEDALGEGWEEAVHPDDRSRVFKSWHLAVEAGTPNFSSIYRFRNRATSHIVEVRGSASPLHDGRGNIVGWVGTLDSLELGSSLVSEPQKQALEA